MMTFCNLAIRYHINYDRKMISIIRYSGSDPEHKNAPPKKMDEKECAYLLFYAMSHA